MNLAIITGRVGRDPEIRHTQNGTIVGNFAVATSERFKDKHTGEKREDTEWHNCVAFGRNAEVLEKWVKKGHLLTVRGKIKTEKYTDKNNINKSVTKIVVDKIDLLPAGKPKPVNGNVVPQDNHLDDDIPF